MIRSILIALVLLVLAVPAHAGLEITLREFRGIGHSDTEAFSASAPWVIEWWSRPPTAIDHDPAHLEVYLYDAMTGEFLGRVVKHAGVGRGDMLIERGGRFRFRVQGQATRWELRVLQIDEEYAERLRETHRPRGSSPRRPLLPGRAP
ncbi:MAG: hypothetical protein JJT93_03585 [Gammaproteobacteria bacterium]|nr:hypothetical protein [Gammaproteobacteria bacterium]TVQ50542.1 MAG: hypothetical protein EA371_00345 [Gammaproteobacteria bacterium]